MKIFKFLCKIAADYKFWSQNSCRNQRFLEKRKFVSEHVKIVVTWMLPLDSMKNIKKIHKHFYEEISLFFFFILMNNKYYNWV